MDDGERTQPQPKQGQLDGARVLVIEDDPPVASFVRDFLAARGCEVACAADGLQGRKAFQESPPDLVVCDLLVPSRNGFQLLEDFAQQAPSVPVVTMSGLYRRSRYDAELAHARLFLEKPLTLDDLEQVARLVAESARTKTRADDGTSDPPEPELPWVPVNVIPLARCLALLARARATGVLSERIGRHRIRMAIVEGQLASIACDAPHLELGQSLVRAGVVTTEQLVGARGVLEDNSSETALEDVLFATLGVGPDDFRRVRELRSAEMLSAAFAATNAATCFQRDDDALAEVEGLPVEMDVRSVIVTGCASQPDDEPFIAHLPDPESTLCLCPDAAVEELQLPPAALAILQELREPRRLAETLAMLRLAGIRARPFVYGLLCADLVRIDGPEPGHQPRVLRARTSLDATVPPLVHAMRLGEEAATGLLTVQDAEGTAWLGLRDGDILCAGSDDARARIGQQLRRAGLITDEQLAVALDIKKRSPQKLLGHLLVELGFLDAGKLLEAARSQARSIAAELLSRGRWSEAWFEEGRLPAARPLEQGESAASLVHAVLRALPAGRLQELAVDLGRTRPAPSLDALADGPFELTAAERTAAASALSGGDAPCDEDENVAEEDALRALVAALLLTPEPAPLPS